jgi:hypothetical protein
MSIPAGTPFQVTILLPAKKVLLTGNCQFPAKLRHVLFYAPQKISRTRDLLGVEGRTTVKILELPPTRPQAAGRRFPIDGSAATETYP